jgi:hypothetical protein
MSKKLLLLFFSLPFMGCAVNWEHPTASQNDFIRDKAICANDAELAVPRVYVPPTSTGIPNPTYYTTCSRLGSFTDCTSTPSTPNNYAVQQMNQSIAQSGENLRRATDVNNFFQNCMLSKGYRIAQKTSSGLFHTTTPPQPIRSFTGEADKNLSLRDKVLSDKVAEGFQTRQSVDGRTFVLKDNVIHGWVLESGNFVKIKD